MKVKLDAKIGQNATSGAGSGASRGHQSIRLLFLCRPKASRPQFDVFFAHFSALFSHEYWAFFIPLAPSGGVTADLLRSTRVCPKMCPKRCPERCPEGVPEKCARKLFVAIRATGTVFGHPFGTPFGTPFRAHFGAHFEARPCRPQQISDHTSARREDTNSRSICKRKKRPKMGKKDAKSRSGSFFWQRESSLIGW